MANSAATIVFLFLILLAAVVPSLGKDYTVGDSSGWTMTGDYKTWASDKTFNVGDNLVFKYGPGHTVDEVSSGDFSSCTVGNSISSDSSGSTTIPLKTAGPHYFICGVIGHCSSGMKLAVTVAAATGAGATPTPSGSSLTPPTTTSGHVPTSSSSSGSVSPSVFMFLSSCLVMVYKLIVS
ncbi:blue copper protein-like [Heracleum sosnowskyi]|uniref:Blue copper protein-like n=1 Tax=Heracleum sosnowskyi TaxID=360622 RepID=A0AAD8N315_9APIA|nr:blue copper protein-like [Heracleum sosnowskyi]